MSTHSCPLTNPLVVNDTTNSRLSHGEYRLTISFTGAITSCSFVFTSLFHTSIVAVCLSLLDFEMNWTGGKLHRHSKANANPLSKAQKQHFAKARLQCENDHTADATSGVHIPHNIHLSLSHINILGERPGPPNQHFKHVRPEYSTEEQTRRESIPLSARERQRESRSIEPETLDDVRRNLLRNPDWLNLSAVKPVKMRFPSARSIANIAKRRKIRKEDRVRQQKGHKRQLSPGSIRNRRKELLSSSAPKVSIRLGSDIHRTQPTSASKVRPAMPFTQFVSSDTMLLDKHATYEQLPQSTEPTSGSDRNDDVWSRNSIGTQGPDEDSGLLTLDRFLDSQTFDQVKERSESHSANGHVWSHSTYPSSPPPLRYLRNGCRDTQGPQRESLVRMDSEDNSGFLIDKTHHPENTSMRDEQIGEPSQNAAKSWHPSPGSQRSRPLYTLDKQIEEERGILPRSSSYNVEPGSYNSPTGRILPQNGDVTYCREQELHDPSKGNVDNRPTLSHTGSVWPSRRSPLQHTTSPMKRPYSNVRNSSRRNDENFNVTKDNEARMKFILGDQLDEINEAFTFDPPKHAPATDVKRRRLNQKAGSDQNSSLEALTWTTGRGLQTPKTVRTSANTVLHTIQKTKCDQRSETDFLSQLSPMEGIIDDRLGDVSVYNNPAWTERSFITAPQVGSIRNLQNAKFITSTPQPQQARSDRIFHGGSNGSTSNYTSRPSQVTQRTLREYSLTPVPRGGGGHFSHYFPNQDQPITTKPTSPHVRSALSDATSITEPGQSSTHRQPLQNIHPGRSSAFTFKKPPVFPSTKSSSVPDSHNTSRISDRFIMPERIAKR